MPPTSERPKGQVSIDMDTEYVQQLVKKAFSKYTPTISTTAQQSDGTPTLEWKEYEAIDWDSVHASTKHANAYCFRKGLIRKAQMAYNIKMYTAKHAHSALATSVPETWIFELDDMDYIDEALMECYEVDADLAANNRASDKKHMFIIKPSLTAKAAGIHVFDSREHLERILECEFDDSDGSDAEMVSQIREWVIQRYIDRPLLFESLGCRKFHLRVYALARGNLEAYVYPEILALFSSRRYARESADPLVHLTNTCLQKAAGDGHFAESDSVRLFWELPMARPDLERVFERIKVVLHDLFCAVAANPTTFQAWPNCVEQFGLDFMLDDELNVFLLEANAYPDFKQTGEELKGVVEGFVDASVAAAVDLMLPGEEDVRANVESGIARLVKVYSKEEEMARKEQVR